MKLSLRLYRLSSVRITEAAEQAEFHCMKGNVKFGRFGPRAIFSPALYPVRLASLSSSYLQGKLTPCLPFESIRSTANELAYLFQHFDNTNLKIFYIKFAILRFLKIFVFFSLFLASAAR